MYFEFEEKDIGNNLIATLFNDVLEKPISCVSYKAARHFLSLNLSYKEFAYLKNDFDGNRNGDEYVSIVDKLKKNRQDSGRSVGYRDYGCENTAWLDIDCLCNRIIYLGTDDKGNEQFSNLEIVNNILIHGSPNSGKTSYLKKMIDLAVSRVDLDRFEYIVWSAKPSEFDGEKYKNHLIDDPHTFVEVLGEMIEYTNQNLLVIIDELYLFLSVLKKKEKEFFLKYMKESKQHHLCFVAASTNMSSLMYDLEEYVDTTMCFGFEYKENASKMNFDEAESEITKQGEFYVYNADEFLLPRKMRV